MAHAGYPNTLQADVFSRYAMTQSIACAKCGQVDDLETVIPLGIHLDKAVLWNCGCGSTRAVAVIDYTAQELVRKAMVMAEMRDWINLHSDPSAVGE